MKLKLDRIISIGTLLASLVAIVLVLKKPTPVAQPQAPAAIAEHAQAFDQKMADFQQATEQTQAQPAGTSSAPKPTRRRLPRLRPAPPSPRFASIPMRSVLCSPNLWAMLERQDLTPDSNLGSAAPTIKDQQVSFDGDVVHGQFLTEIAGKDVWITVSGHLGDQGGYATFEPTEFKVGDLSVPVSLVNPALQKKLGEQRDRLKLPDGVGDLKVENGELVMQGR